MRTCLPTCLVVLCFALSLFFRAAPARAQSESPTFRGDLRHSGVYETAAVHRLDGVKWRFATDGAVRSSPAVVGGAVYFGSGDGHVYAVDAATGRERWRFATGGAVHASPAVDGGTVYVTSRDGKVYALDAATGGLRWAYETGPDLPYEWGFDYYTSSPAVAGGMVYAGSGDGHLYALDAATGRVRWRYRAAGRVRSSPAVAGGVVYVGDYAGRLHAVDAATGQARWVFETDGAALDPADFGFDRQAIVSSPAVAGDLVVVGGRDGFLYAVDRQTGAERWRVDHQVSWVISSPAVGGGVVYTGTSDGQFVQAVDLAGGAERWRVPVSGTAWPSPAVAGGMVYVGASGGLLYALDAATGARRWVFRAGSSFFATPVVAGGVVYTGNDDGTLYALTGDAGPAPPAPVLHKVVFWEEVGPPTWFLPGRDVFLRAVFETDGYTVVDRDSLARFMEARVADGAPSVVAFATHYVPPPLVADTSEAALLRRYLEKGRVVWLSPAPLGWTRDASTGRFAGLDYGVLERVLGLRYPGPDTRGVGGFYDVQLTDEGRRWGLERGWVGHSALDAAQVTTVLAVDENGRAAAWLKHYGGPPGTGLLQLWVDRDLPENLEAILNAAEHGLY